MQFITYRTKEDGKHVEKFINVQSISEANFFPGDGRLGECPEDS